MIGGAQSYLHSNSVCYIAANCPTGTYPSNQNGIYLCSTCPIGCDTCSVSGGSLTCSKCKTVVSTNYFLSESSCVTNCPSGTYKGTAGGSPSCVDCESPCASCSGSGTISCQSCAIDRLIHGTTTCGPCPSGQYEATATTCGLCNTNCLSCLSTSATHCLTCGLLSSTQSYLLSSDHKCYNDCPGATY